MVRGWIVSAAFFACAVPAAAQELVGPVDPWGGFEKGALARFVVDMQFKAPVGAQAQPQRIEVKLVRLADDIAEVETQNQTGSAAPQTRKFRRDAAGANPSAGELGADRVKSTKTGTEDLKVGGKIFACEIWEVTYRKNTVSGHAPVEVEDTLKIWRSEKVPGGIVRVEGKQTGPGGGPTAPTVSTFQGKLASLEERIKAGGQELTCALLEIEVEMTGGRPGKATQKLWLCDKVPGKVARRVVDSPGTIQTWELQEFK
ncbi:MAG TPA: hypothetical protein VI643_00105 [Planctomycetota bacterium]|nr:hypothetical protein [Planctomycetota bacterium]